MMELQIVLKFACVACTEAVSVTVKCEGKGLAVPGQQVARVHVPCPGCGMVHRLDFEPNGNLLAVRPNSTPRPHLEPSLN